MAQAGIGREWRGAWMMGQASRDTYKGVGDWGGGGEQAE